jgi:hypothetical protein
MLARLADYNNANSSRCPQEHPTGSPIDLAARAGEGGAGTQEAANGRR